ncbi:SusD/RagB family nutrient-binding outer membrane lipoprotein [Chitinophaga alhagiae]|uniref:SusD/RagB family nutrient-binding outer membrane lipoprotein n=2 Tax=Chitinophaga alhagiae TaxID=2203219 RepID=A0ABM6W9V4_9BACT|nr:SusD/RagB family nutrient-binding outer membrane lipoprotein [Chitinophaga alhagiae]
MKQIRFKHITSAVMLGLMLTSAVSCKKDFGDMNVNPNTPAEPSTKFLFGSAVLGLAGVTNAAGGVLYVQHLGEFIYNNESRYFNREYSYNGIYAGPLMDLTRMIQLNTDPATKDTKAVTDNGPNDNQLGHARILRAFLMLHMTDRWGAIPYSDALKGIDQLQPAFDQQKAIYADLLKELKEAPAQITRAMPNDPLFDGNFERWKRWGNSLRAIAAMRIVKTEDAEAGKTAFQEAVAAGIMTSADDDAAYSYLAQQAFESPWYTNYRSRYDYGVSETFINRLSDLADPRLPIMARPPKLAPGTYKGVPYGRNVQYETDGHSLIGTTPAAQAFPAVLTSYAQMCFTMAEAALRGWVPGGDAEVMAWYNKGIDASIRKWKKLAGSVATDLEITAYQAELAVILQPAQTFDQKLERIMTQKWINFYLGNGYEAWAEWRRTGYPVLSPAPDAVNVDKQIPRRQCYIGTERDLNKANYDAALAAQGPDELSTRLWWDKP